MNLIKKYVRINLFQFSFSILFAILGVLASLISYIFLARIITELISNNSDWDFYLKQLLIIVGLFLIKEISAGVSTTISHTATFQSLRDIRKEISEKLFEMPLGDITSVSSGTFKDIIVDKVDSMETTLSHILPEMTANIIGPILLIVYMLILDWRLSIISLLPFIIGMGVMKSVMNKEYTKSYKESVLLGQKMNNALVEYIGGIEVIKAFNQGTSSYKKYSDAVRDNAQFYYDWMGRCMNRISVGRLLSPMGILTVIPFGMIFYKNGSIKIDILISIVVLSFATVSNLLKALNYTDDLARISTISGEVEKVLNSKPLKQGVSTQKIQHYDIEYKDVNFSYDEDKKIINHLDLKFEEGTVNALVGESGSGKSTIAKLLAGFWNVESGCIKIGDININTIPLSQLSQLISYVSQDNFLFDISIKDNIRVAKPDATDSEVEQIAIKAGCDEFIKDLSDGYDTVVGEGGGHLSGGEKQRISIARAMLKDSPIIILDEATSYIDPENEVSIQRAISKLAKGKTLIIIAHRLNTIKDVDKIFIVYKGRIQDSGTHEELLVKSEMYQSMWKASNKEGRA
ncbi:MAG: ABC transporter ATP-binding protein [Intestinibacter bartlettii]|uniref:ABC transporter ATP-binding protein n=2 Tax=Bacillota TaxID=1239 RepID=A0A552UWA3_9FIRM|nr:MULTISPECIES: ABC transporter ATP-binding protein [Bacillota]MBS4889770.1 ABC transporter ATP-binding protein [Anaerococcus vaginalis]MDU6824267.1 ABC transporter ATP-binding protein [Intestinibacter bartlettii]MEB3428564.1 ABC transporter ATP-binding protein [Citroniella saccharovorans]TRW22489.1 ABC transporter ATP-binding protein [Criibacterium bergeronii]CAC9937044.1 ABC transporter, ATP-binding protein [Peptoniphilus coxii]